METIAVYWEPKIKTYGVFTANNLILVEVAVPTDKLSCWEGLLQKLETMTTEFCLVFLQCWNHREMKFYIVCRPATGDQIRSALEDDISGSIGETVYSAIPIEMVHFQGPHFSERFGIADTTLKALNHGGVKIMAAAFSGSVVYLLLAEGDGQRAKGILDLAFEVPKKPDF